MMLEEQLLRPYWVWWRWVAVGERGAGTVPSGVLSTTLATVCAWLQNLPATATPVVPKVGSTGFCPTQGLRPSKCRNTANCGLD